MELPELVPERPELDRYLEDTIVVDWQTPLVLERARALSAGLDSDAARARVLYEWVRDAIPHTADAGLDVVTCSASDVLRRGTGIGYSKSHLLAALLRAVGIPTGFCYQVLRPGARSGPTLLYGFNGSLLGGDWLPLDARGNRKGIEARFPADAPRLGVTARAERGERVYPTIFARPARVVVELLDRNKSLSAIADHMPSDLPGS